MNALGKKSSISELQQIAFTPYEEIENPTTEDWQEAYDALSELCRRKPKDALWDTGC